MLLVLSALGFSKCLEVPGFCSFLLSSVPVGEKKTSNRKVDIES